MSNQDRGELTDKYKIDRVAWHEEVRFLKKQQWAVTTAGVVLLGALLATIRNMHMTALDRFGAVALIAGGVWAGWFFLESLQNGLAVVRRRLDPSDRDAATRGREIVTLHKAILAGSALVVVWAALFKLH
jgi:hypothetical protein